MFTEARIALLVGSATFVRAEFLSLRRETLTPRMGALLFTHNSLLFPIIFTGNNTQEN